MKVTDIVNYIAKGNSSVHLNIKNKDSLISNIELNVSSELLGLQLKLTRNVSTVDVFLVYGNNEPIEAQVPYAKIHNIFESILDKNNEFISVIKDILLRSTVDEYILDKDDDVFNMYFRYTDKEAICNINPKTKDVSVMFKNDLGKSSVSCKYDELFSTVFEFLWGE